MWQLASKIDRPMQCSPGSGRTVRLLTILSLIVLFLSLPAWAQRAESSQPTRSTGLVQAIVTTQGSIPLGGALVTLRHDDSEVASLASDAGGKVRFERLRAGTY